MAQKPKAVKYKVVSGYLLLFIIAVVSVWFVYTEILKIAAPNRQTAEDSKKIIRISNTIADLYASEAIGRSSILTGADKDVLAYNNFIDSIDAEVNAIKENVEETQRPKFDSISLLLNRKKKSVNDIVRYRKNFNREKTIRSSISGIYNIKDSIKSTVQPVQMTKRYQWNDLVSSVLPPRQLDSLSKLPVSNDSLAMAFDKVLTDLLVKEKRLNHQLFQKEQQLLEENRIISDQLRVILSSVENEFLQNSYTKITESQAQISNTINTMAYVGAATFLILIVFASLIIRDLTSNQNYRRQLELLNNENESLLRSKSMLMATVTHDLQTPLGSIMGFHDLLKDAATTPKQKQYLDNIKESAGYIVKLVNDLLDFSKLENNRISIEKKPFNLKALIENTCKTLEPIAVNKNIELNWDIDEELNGGFLSDSYRIKQVLTNLVSNAVKFTSEGSVEVTGKIENNAVYIAILDTGIGIARDKHGDVFKEFTQAHTGIEKKFGGTGLGLTISKKITELLGGTILLESEEGQGSIFTIKLPYEPVPGFKDVEEAVSAGKGYEALKGRRLLIADDDKVQLSLMKALFSAFPVQVDTEINSSSVISRLEQQEYDAVLTDIQMPVLDGFSLLALIREHKNPVIAAMPVVALSGRRDIQTSDFLAKGFTGHHPKPIQLEALLALLASLFGDNAALPNAQVQAEHTPDDAPLYNLRSLSQFTNNDPVSLRTIITTFIESANDNCAALVKAVEDKDSQRMAETAHRMIPMLRQMEIHTIAALLEPVEERKLNMDWEETGVYIAGICARMKELTLQLAREVA